MFGSEAMFRAINDCIQVLGGVGFGAGGAYPFEVSHQPLPLPSTTAASVAVALHGPFLSFPPSTIGLRFDFFRSALSLLLLTLLIHCYCLPHPSSSCPRLLPASHRSLSSLQRLMRDARILLIFEGTNEILRLFTALSGIQLTGASLKALQKSPLAAVGQAPTLISRMLAGKYGMAVGAMAVPGVHATFARESEALGHALTRFNYSLTALLARHGKDVIEQQLQLQRVADMAIDAYGCLAVLSRATAALASAVPHAEHETVLARSFVQGALRRIHRNVDDVVAGAGANGDAETLRIATETLKAGKYLATHPLRLTSDVAAVA